MMQNVLVSATPPSSQVFNLSVFHVNEIDSDLPHKEDENEKSQGQRKSADEVPHLLEPDTLQPFAGTLERGEAGKNQHGRVISVV